MSNFNCPYCNNQVPINGMFHRTLYLDRNLSSVKHDSAYIYVVLHSLYCPACENTIFRISTKSKNFDESSPVLPSSDAKPLPDYIPQHICEDYREAFDILHLSPKASATLARRCLQSMIHDFWNIKEKNLNAEISALKPLIEPELFNALHDLRSLGNIAAHSEYDASTIIDIEPEEAKLLLNLIELLIEDWYITRHNKQKLLQRISDICTEKESMRND